MEQALPKRPPRSRTRKPRALDVAALTRTWTAFDRIAGLRPIRSETDYDKTVVLMNSLLDLVGDDESHALSGLLDLVSEMVSDYESRRFALEQVEPRDALRYLMESHGLRQADLASVVAQGNLSAILAGKRKISASLAGKLARFFDVSPALFVPSP